MSYKVISFANPMFGEQEKEALIKTAEQKILTKGSNNEKFAEDFYRYIEASKEYVCIPTSSATAALHIAYMSLGLKAGDEVIVPAMTHVATAHAVEMTGATPVFIDCSSCNGGNSDWASIISAITNKTKAISIVHFLGQGHDIYRILNICKDYGLHLIEDCALSLGCNYYNSEKHTGTLSDFACFSFYPCKAITTGEGGMLVCKKEFEHIARRAMEFGKIGTSSAYDIVSLGVNYRMNEFNAALGIVQLKRLQEENWMQKRKENKEKYKVFSSLVNNGLYAHSLLFKTKERRNFVKDELAEAGIETSIYYPKPVPSFSYYRAKYGYQPIRFKNAEQISNRCLTLPIGPHLDVADISYITENLRRILNSDEK